MNPDPYAPVDPDTPLRFDHLLHLLTTIAIWCAVFIAVSAATLSYWRLHSPETFERDFAAPARRMRWRLWAILTWERLAKRCGLSASEHVTRKDNEGRPATTTVWFHPKLVQVKASGHCLHLTVRTRTGLTVEDLERAVPAIRDAARAHSARSVVIAPGAVQIELVMREQLAAVNHSAPSSALAVRNVQLGRCENGNPWTLTITGRHTLTVGCSGAGKGSIFWGIAGGYGPAVAAGLVRLVGIDLKYGIELSVGANLFTKIATTESEAVKTLAALEKLMDKRGLAMAGKTREHTPTTSAPLTVLLIDELAGGHGIHERPGPTQGSRSLAVPDSHQGPRIGHRRGGVPPGPPQRGAPDARIVHPNHRAAAPVPRGSHDGAR